MHGVESPDCHVEQHHVGHSTSAKTTPAMRLLYLEDDGSVKLTRNYAEEEVPDYAVLSHTWLAEEDEVTYQDLKKGHGAQKVHSYAKIRLCGELAAREGLQYFWQVLEDEF
ncbi:hypothetical protein LTS10_011262 [Elasticomyces elasticus]|nr:hypothetical protein LTS10_011262 [Elasticomyces elasticus]